MTVGVSRQGFPGSARLGKVTSHTQNAIGEDEVSIVETVGPRISSKLEFNYGGHVERPLKANQSICFQGVVPAGDGFKLTDEDLAELGYKARKLPLVIKSYIIGKDLVQKPQTRFIIDFFGLDEKVAQSTWPDLFQRLLDRVYPERVHNNRETYKQRWWIFAEPRPAMRLALSGLSRFIVTPYTAKHRPFLFVPGETLPDAMAYAIASDDAFILGVLSSRAHSVWALDSGGTLEDRPRYNSNKTFLPFPFPACTDNQRQVIRDLAESLDSHRKQRLALHADLTITSMYNVLNKLRADEPLSSKEKDTHEQGLISVFKRIQDDLDAKVFEAYGWPSNLSDQEVLQRLVVLNAERADEEDRSVIRWLRAEFQNPTGQKVATQGKLIEEPEEDKGPRAKPKVKTPWPKTLPERAQAVKAALAAQRSPVTPEQLAKTFLRARVEGVEELLDTLASLGQARQLHDGRFVAPTLAR